MRPVPRADNLTTFMCRLCRNSGSLTSWSRKGLSRPVMGLLYFVQIFLIGVQLLVQLRYVLYVCLRTVYQEVVTYVI